MKRLWAFNRGLNQDSFLIIHMHYKDYWHLIVVLLNLTTIHNRCKSLTKIYEVSVAHITNSIEKVYIFRLLVKNYYMPFLSFKN